MKKLSAKLNFLLAFVEVFKERLAAADLMNLLFLYAQKYGCAYYSFFPCKEGYFSYEVCKAKRSLVEKGYLVDDADAFAAVRPMWAYFELTPMEKSNLYLYHKHAPQLRGDALVQKVCTERSAAPERPAAANDAAIFTIGYESITIDEYLRRLVEADIDVLADVRNNPWSMKFDFNQKRLQECVNQVSIEYLGLPELGIPSAYRVDLNTDAAYRELFEFYDTELLPHHMDQVEKIAALIRSGKKVALTCFEKDFNHCHRFRIARKMHQNYGFDIVNL